MSGISRSEPFILTNTEREALKLLKEQNAEHTARVLKHLLQLRKDCTAHGEEFVQIAQNEFIRLVNEDADDITNTP